ncbi:MAG: alkaline phosphatase D family protein [Microthrixaceae bacterium]
MDRRVFLSSIAAATVAVACASDGDGDGGDGSGSSSTAPKKVEVATPAASPELPPGSFALGVASGDALADRVLLWTRLVSEPTAADGGSPTGPIEVAYDMATDEAFTDLVASGVTTATGDLGHSVHVDVTNLEPDTWYFYRFRAGDQTSPVGRTRTMPAPDADASQLKFVFASCQDYQWGYYAAWKNAAAEPDLDAVVFLGDYIYETNLGDLSPDKNGARVWANAGAFNLEEYRQRYAQTHSDPSLQAAHQAVPWIVTFDDHEVSNNYAGDVGQGDVDQPNSGDRKRAAYQAWYENMPIRVEEVPTTFDEILVHRSSQFGTLATMYAIETRQNADVPPCRAPIEPGTPELALSDDGPDCAEREDPSRTNLGEEQEQWLSSGMAESTTTWNVLCNPLMMCSLNIGTPEEPEYTRDTWDGYPVVRERVLEGIRSNDVPGPVVVTGDWHATFVNEVKETPDGETIVPEFLATSMTTVNFSQDYTAANPQVLYFEGTTHGYGLVTVTPEEFVCEFKSIGDVWDPDSPITQVETWKVSHDSHVPQQG